MKNIGVKTKQPKKKCADRHCPFHGNIKVRGRIFSGKIIKSLMNKTATVENTRSVYIPKYERFENRRSRIKVHNPLCIDAKIGDEVRIMETKPISKTKNFVIIEVVKNETDKVENK